MNFALKNLLAIVLAIGVVVSCYAQDCSSLNKVNLPKECYPAVDKAYSYYDKDSDSAGGGLNLLLLGNRSDILRELYIYVRKDVLIMFVSHYAPRSIIPTSVGFEITSYSKEPSKYKNNHRLTIYVYDKLLLSENLEVRTSGGIVEKFLLEMKYTDFLKFTEAKKVTIQLGETKIELKPEQVEALNDLNKTTKQLKPPPPFPIM